MTNWIESFRLLLRLPLPHPPLISQPHEIIATHPERNRERAQAFRTWLALAKLVLSNRLPGTRETAGEFAL
jgi:hypothetical protein